MIDNSMDPVTAAQAALTKEEIDPSEIVRETLGKEQANDFAQHLGKLISSGTMPLGMFRSLPRKIQRMYKARNVGRRFHTGGRPMSQEEIKIYKQHRRKRKKKNRMERRARAEMYRHQR